MSTPSTSPMLRGALRAATGPAAVYLLSTVLAKAGAFFLIPIYTRRLTVEEYGDFALAQTLVTMLPTLLSLGLASAVTRFYFDGLDREAAKARVGGAARWMVALTLSAAALLQAALLLAWPAGGRGITGRWELSCIVWASAGAATSVLPALYLRAAQRPLAAAAFQLGQFASVLASGLLLVVVLGRGLRGSIEASALAFGVDGVVGIVFVGVALKGPMTRPLLHEALRFSLPFVPHFAANQLQFVADRWTMKVAGLQADLGGYALASQVIAPAGLVVQSWHDAVSPQMGELCRVGGLRGLRDRFLRFQTSYLLSGIVPSLLIVLALPLVGWIVGGAFAQTLRLVPLLALSIAIETIYFPNANVLFYANRPRHIPTITIASALANLGLNILLIPPLGVHGAIAARIVSMAGRSAAMWLVARAVFADSSARPA